MRWEGTLAKPVSEPVSEPVHCDHRAVQSFRFCARFRPIVHVEPSRDPAVTERRERSCTQCTVAPAESFAKSKPCTHCTPGARRLVLAPGWNRG